MSTDERSTPAADRAAPRWTWIGFVGVALFFWCAILVTFVVIVPRQKKKIDEYGLQIPTSTKLVIDVSMWFADYWWVLVPGVALFGVLLGGLTYLVREHARSRALRMAWNLILFGLPVIVLLFVWLSLWLPWLKLQEGFRK